MNTKTIETRAMQARDAARNVGRKIAAVGTAIGGAVLSSSAMAQTVDLGAEATTALTGLKDDIGAILVILVGAVFLFVLYSFIKRAK